MPGEQRGGLTFTMPCATVVYTSVCTMSGGKKPSNLYCRPCPSPFSSVTMPVPHTHPFLCHIHCRTRLCRLGNAPFAGSQSPSTLFSPSSTPVKKVSAPSPPAVRTGGRARQNTRTRCLPRRPFPPSVASEERARATTQARSSSDRQHHNRFGSAGRVRNTTGTNSRKCMHTIAHTAQTRAPVATGQCSCRQYGQEIGARARTPAPGTGPHACLCHQRPAPTHQKSAHQRLPAWKRIVSSP